MDNNILDYKIDFAAIITATHCNPNGDPTNGNRPRQDYDGYGLISDVCLKRKIRNRAQDMGYPILLPMDERNDGFSSIHQRIVSDPDLAKLFKNGKDQNMEEFLRQACKKWYDVRCFGHVFAFKSEKGVSANIRGPVSIQHARSIDVVDIMTLQITKSLNSDTDPKNPSHKGSDTMGEKHIINNGVYVTYGSVYPKLAAATGFTNQDASILKEAIWTLFENDASAARPSGCMEVKEVYWWEQNPKKRQHSSAKIHHSLQVIPTEESPYYEVILNNLEGITPTVMK